MSEYTDYYIAKLNDLDQAVEQLESTNIQTCILEGDAGEHWYVLLSKMADLHDLGKLFPLCGHVQVDENPDYWKLSFSLSGQIITLVGPSETQTQISDIDQILLAATLGTTPTALCQLINDGIWTLLETLALPAMVLLDQRIAEIRPGITHPGDIHAWDVNQASKNSPPKSEQSQNPEPDPGKKKLKRVQGVSKHGPHFTDGHRIYHSWDDLGGPFVPIPEADAASFVNIGNCYAEDANHVYWHDKPLPLVEPSTFTTDGFWGKNDHQVFYKGKLIPDVDATSLDWSMTFYARDHRHVFYGGNIVQGADPATFEVFGHSGYARDHVHVYYQNQIVLGADPDSFKPGRSFGHGQDRFRQYAYGEPWDGQ